MQNQNPFLFYLLMTVHCGYVLLDGLIYASVIRAKGNNKATSYLIDLGNWQARDFLKGRTVPLIIYIGSQVYRYLCGYYYSLFN